MAPEPPPAGSPGGRAELDTNDVWVAAHTMEAGAELLSLDRHVEAVEGLAWTSPPDL